METEYQQHGEAPGKIAPMTLTAIGSVGAWAQDIRQAVLNERERRKRGEGAELHDGQIELSATIQKMLGHLEVLGLFVPLNEDGWPAEAKVFIDDIDKLRDADALTLRRLLSYHKRKAGSSKEYWNELAMSGHLTRILLRLQTIYQEVCDRTFV